MTIARWRVAIFATLLGVGFIVSSRLDGVSFIIANTVTNMVGVVLGASIVDAIFERQAERVKRRPGR